MSHKPPDPGELIHLMTVETPIAQAGTFDLTTDGGWSPLGKRWGTLEPLTGQKLQVAMQMIAEVTHERWMRFDPNLSLTPACRMTFRGRVFGVVYVLNLLEQGIWWYVLLREVVAA